MEMLLVGRWLGAPLDSSISSTVVTVIALKKSWAIVTAKVKLGLASSYR